MAEVLEKEVTTNLPDLDTLIKEQGFDDHFHELHEGDRYQSGFFSKYIFSMDHKIIARQFLITGIMWAIIGGLMSIVFRLQLGFPSEDYAWLKPILGKWITISDAGTGSIAPEFYYALITMHGTIIVFMVLTAGLSGTFSNLLIPLQVGARDMASPFLNMLSYWFFFLSSMVMLFSLFLSVVFFYNRNVFSFLPLSLHFQIYLAISRSANVILCLNRSLNLD